MGVFLFFGAITWLIVAALIIAEGRTRVQNGLQLRSYRIGSTKITFQPMAAKVFAWTLALALAAIIAILTAGQVMKRGYLYTTYDFFTSRIFVQAVLGCIFGALLASWMMRMYRSKRASELSMSQKIEGIALLLLFIVGGTSISIEEVLRGFRFGTDGVSFGLASTEATGAAAPASNGADVIEPPSEEGKPLTRHNDNGLALLGGMPSLMERDANYIKADVAAEKAWIADPVAAKDQMFDLGIQDARASQLKTAAEFYDRRFSRLATCLAAVRSAAGDSIYIAQQLTPAKIALRELFMYSLAEHGHAPHSMIPAAAKFNLELMQLEGRLADHALPLRSGAAALVALTARKQPSVASEEISGLDTCISLHSQSEDTAKEEARIQTIAVGGYADRPYLAIAYAAILQLEQQELAGVDAIAQWQAVQAAAVLANKKARQEQIVRRWYEIRALSTQYLLLEDLFKREPAQPELVRDRQIAVIEKLIAALSKTRYVRYDFSKIFEPTLDYVKGNFTSNIDSPKGCDFDELSMRVNFSLLSSKLNYVQATINHSAFMDRYVQKAKEYIEDVVSANMACMDANFSESDAAVFRAEAFKSYALLQLAEARERRPISPNYREVTAATLTTANNALLLARSIIEPFGNPDLDGKAAVRATQLQSINRERALWEEINALVLQNQRAMDQLALH